jgi:hypothetical protein
MANDIDLLGIIGHQRLFDGLGNFPAQGFDHLEGREIHRHDRKTTLFEALLHEKPDSPVVKEAVQEEDRTLLRDFLQGLRFLGEEAEGVGTNGQEDRPGFDEDQPQDKVTALRQESSHKQLWIAVGIFIPRQRKAGGDDPEDQEPENDKEDKEKIKDRHSASLA